MPFSPLLRRSLAAAVTLVAAVAATLAASAVATADPGLQVTARGWVTDTSHTAFSPAATRAANGDVLVIYNTDGDSIRGASVWLTRSSDEGATWSTPTQVLRPLWYSGGSSNASLGLATLRDGTILMPASESIVHTPYTDRESVTYVLRSTDHGVTWSGAGSPIRLPTAMYYNATYGKVIELASGVVLLPVWGAPSAPPTPGGVERSTPWQAGVLRSFDGGRTWSDYRRIGIDDVSPPAFSNPNGQWPTNVTETSVAQLRDGRLVALMRTDTWLNTGNRYFYLSYSDDDGATWSEPRGTLQQGTGHALSTAPCTASLPGTRTKLLLGSNDPATSGLLTRVSYDAGATWRGGVVLQDPAGATGGYSIYPDFVPLSGNRVLAIYGRVQSGGPTRVAWNMLQDQTGSACTDELDAADADARARLGLHLMRADHAGWPWPFGRRATVSTATNTLSGMLPALAQLMNCQEAGLTVWKNGVQLSPSATLTASGVVDGDTLTIRGTAPTGNVRTGWTEFDRHPVYGRIFGWDTSCAQRPMALDYRQRSLGLDVTLRSGQSISSISLRDSDGSSRLTAGDYAVWTSADNDTWTPVSGWTLSAATSGGRLVHTFRGLALTQRYVKISQRYADTAYTFVLDDLRSDVTVTVTP